MFHKPKHYKQSISPFDARACLSIDVLRYIPLINWNVPMHSPVGLYVEGKNSHKPLISDVNLYHMEKYRPVTHQVIASMTSGTIINSDDKVVLKCGEVKLNNGATMYAIASRIIMLTIATELMEVFCTDNEWTDDLSEYTNMHHDEILPIISELFFDIECQLMGYPENVLSINNIGTVINIKIMGNSTIYEKHLRM